VSQPRFSLVLLACGRFLSTSARRIDCQFLAEELAPLEVAWTPGRDRDGPMAPSVLSMQIRAVKLGAGFWAGPDF